MAPVLGSFGLERYGPRVVWGACFVVGVGVAVGQLFAAPARERRLREIRAEREPRAA